jgi:hypothetical protein
MIFSLGLSVGGGLIVKLSLNQTTYHIKVWNKLSMGNFESPGNFLQALLMSQFLKNDYSGFLYSQCISYLFNRFVFGIIGGGFPPLQ